MANSIDEATRFISGTSFSLDTAEKGSVFQDILIWQVGGLKVTVSLSLVPAEKEYETKSLSNSLVHHKSCNEII